MNKQDLIGKQFGKLLVLKFDRIEHRRDSKGKNRDKGYWICRCDCGREVSIERNMIVSGKTKSCGCLIKENAQKRGKELSDLTGKRFGKLLVLGLEKTANKIYSNGTSAKDYFWRCKCDCGNEVVVKGRILRDGKTTDCEIAKRNASKSYTKIGNEFKKENILKEGTRIDYLSNKKSKANTSGVRGVDFSKEKNKYRARIRFKGKEYHLGYFNTIADAEKARHDAEKKIYHPIVEKYNYCKNDENQEEFE